MKVYVLLYMVYYEGDLVAGVTASEYKAKAWVEKGKDDKLNPYHFVECELEKFKLWEAIIEIEAGA